MLGPERLQAVKVPPYLSQLPFRLQRGTEADAPCSKSLKIPVPSMLSDMRKLRHVYSAN